MHGRRKPPTPSLTFPHLSHPMTQEIIDTIKKALAYYQQRNENALFSSLNDDDAATWQARVDQTAQAMKEAQELPAMARALHNIGEIEELVSCGVDGAPDASDYGFLCNQVYGLCHAY